MYQEFSEARLGSTVYQRHQAAHMSALGVTVYNLHNRAQDLTFVSTFIFDYIVFRHQINSSLPPLHSTCLPTSTLMATKARVGTVTLYLWPTPAAPDSRYGLKLHLFNEP